MAGLVIVAVTTGPSTSVVTVLVGRLSLEPRTTPPLPDTKVELVTSVVTKPIRPVASAPATVRMMPSRSLWDSGGVCPYFS